MIYDIMTTLKKFRKKLERAVGDIEVEVGKFLLKLESSSYEKLRLSKIASGFSTLKLSNIYLSNFSFFQLHFHTTAYLFLFFIVQSYLLYPRHQYEYFFGLTTRNKIIEIGNVKYKT